jgi:alkylated DNA repair protein (DNA oxidative demethylase)
MTDHRPTTRRRGARSSRGGEPVAPPEEVATGQTARQMTLTFDTDAPAPTPQHILPGVVHIPNWLDRAAQQRLAADFGEWARPPAGLRRPRVPTGHLMSVQSVCLGWHWYPYVYSKTADDTDNAPVKPLPANLVELARAGVAAAYGAHSAEAAAYSPDAAIVNLYPDTARLGLHQDGEEPSDAPVVTLSLGDTCTFRLAAVDRRVGPFTDLAMGGGDLLVFGRENRRIFHGVPKVFAGSAPFDLGFPGRLSITVRETGLS